MKSKILTSVVMAAAAIVASAPLAHANSELELISGATTVTVVGVGGLATYAGAVGSWNVNVTTGETGPILGINTLDLNSTDTATGGTAAPLEILWSADGFAQLGGYNATVGGTETAGITDAFSTYYGPALLSQANVLTPASALTFTSSPFAGTATGSISGSTPFAMTEEVLISGATSAASQTSFDFNLSVPVPDGGGTLILLGGAMTAMGMIRSKVGKRK